MMTQQDAENLLDRYVRGTASEDEKRLVEKWYYNESAGRSLADEDDFEHLAMDLWTGTRQRAGLVKKARTLTWYLVRTAAAAAVLIFFSTVLFQLLHKKPPAVNAEHQIADIAPGGNRAILILADGHKIVLANAEKGRIATQGATEIRKTGDGEVQYTMKRLPTNNNRSPLVYNTIQTPRGGQFHMTLSDGTKVWLNAASSITYPVIFNGSERKVEITGEAYFDVQHNSAMPFRVVAGRETIEDIGTRFDINSYDDEAVIETTLAEGAAKVTLNTPIQAGIKSVILRPGNQSVILQHPLPDHDDQIKVVTIGDTGISSSWKDGFFQFDDTPLREVMQQLSRWYDVDVSYQGNAPIRSFTGKLYRNVNISGVLDILAFKKVRYKITLDASAGNRKKITIINGN